MASIDGRLDHVTIAASDLSLLTSALRRFGLHAPYVGRDETGRAHTAQLGFEDGTYLELLSVAPDAESVPHWNDYVQHDGGICGWAMRVTDIQPAVEVVRDADIAVEGPRTHHREVDGDTLVWEVARPDPASTLPLLVADQTARDERTRPGEGSGHSALTGIEYVVVGVEDLEAAIDRYRTCFGMDEPAEMETDELSLAAFTELPVILLAGESDWLRERLAQFGPGPISCILSSADPAASADRFNLRGITEWGQLQVGWIPVTQRRGIADLGVRL